MSYGHRCSRHNRIYDDACPECAAEEAEEREQLEARVRELEAGLEKIMFLEPCRGDCQGEKCPAGIAQVTLGREPQSEDPCCDHYDREKRVKELETAADNLLAFFVETPGITLPWSQDEIIDMIKAARKLRKALKGKGEGDE